MVHRNSLVLPHSIFASSWIAGATKRNSALLKSFNRHEIDSINIVNLCEKLRSGILQQTTANEVIKQEKEDDDDNKTSSEKLSFSVYSRLVYGTLLIFNQQVDNLLEDTERLLNKDIRSFVINDFYEKRNIVRRQCLRDSRGKRKIVNDENVPDFMPYKKQLLAPEQSNNVFTQLLNEAESLPTHASMDVFSEEQFYSAAQLSTNGTNGRGVLREIQITIREYDTTLNLAQCEKPDECTGFGNATDDEISSMLQLFVDNSKEPELKSFSKTAIKRKNNSKNEYILCKRAKSFYNDDDVRNDGTNNISSVASIELVRDSNNSNSDSLLPLEIAQLNNNNLQEKSVVDFNISAGPEIYENLITCTNEMNIKTEDLHSVSPSLPEIQISPFQVATNARRIAKRIKPKLIIDKCIRLSREDFLKEADNYYNKIIKKRKTKIQHNPTANELLCILKFGKMFPNIALKKPSFESISDEYINLTRSIFGSDYTENVANEIYPQWNNNNTLEQQQHHKRQRRSIPTATSLLMEDHINETNLLLALPQMEEQLSQQIVVENVTNRFTAVLNTFENNNNNNTKKDENSAIKTMMQLLDIWCNNDNEKINVNAFLAKISTRLDAALTVHHLLELSRDKFIIITKIPETCIPTDILIGPKSEKLIAENIS